MTLSNIVIEHSNLCAKIVDPSKTAEYTACLRLRHSYFCLERGWVPDSGTQQESDRYDPYCQHLAVFHHNNTHQTLLAYMRLLPWNHYTGFMLEHEFKELLAPEQLQSIINTNSAELSRLVIAPEVRKCDVSHTLLCFTEQSLSDGAIIQPRCATVNGNGSNALEPVNFTPHVLELLFKLMYQVSQQMGITSYYIVVEPPLLAILRRKFCLPFQPMGKPYMFPNGTQTQAAFAPVRNIEEALADKHPDKLRWYQCAD